MISKTFVIKFDSSANSEWTSILNTSHSVDRNQKG